MIADARCDNEISHEKHTGFPRSKGTQFAICIKAFDPVASLTRIF